MDGLNKNDLASLLIFFCSYLTFLITFDVDAQVIVFSVLAFSQLILKLGLKIRTFSKSTFPGQWKNVLTFIPRWPETGVRGQYKFGKYFVSYALSIALSN